MLISKYNINKLININILKILFITLFLIISFNFVNADTTYGHYTYIENEDGTIKITKYDGTAVNNLVIPSSINGKKVTVIGESAFEGCTKLTGNLTIGNSVKTIELCAFDGCSGLTGNLTIGNSVTSIGAAAFRDCSGLTGNLTIPNSVTDIGNYAFSGCSSLNGNLTIGNSVKNIQFAAFWNCKNLTGNLSIPASVTTIGDWAFRDCTNLTGKLTIPSGITKIGYYAFNACNGLTEIEVSQTNKNYSSVDGVLFNKDKTKLIVFPAGKNATSYTIPSSVTSIEDSAFICCSSLTSLVIPNSVITIGENAFYNCENLKSLIIPSSVTSIGSLAFGSCGNLTSLIIPSSVTSIGGYATEACRNLRSVIFYTDKSGGKAPEIESTTFRGLLVQIYYKEGTTGFDGENWPVSKMVPYEEGFEKSTYTLDGLSQESLKLSYPFSEVVTIKTMGISNSNIAYITTLATGEKVLNAKQNGKTKINAVVGYPGGSYKTISADLVVDIKAKSISLSNTSHTFNTLSDMLQLSSTILPENVNNKVVIWTSSNTKVATVDSTGKVTPVGNGTCKIVATTTDGTNLSASCNVTVSIKATSISLDRIGYTFDKYETLKLTSTVLPENTSNKTVKWTSSNTKVATVDSVGNVKPVGEGTAIITATTTDGTNLSATCIIISNIKFLLGDINKDGRVNINDVNYGLRGLTKGTLTAEEKQIGDVNQDGNFNINDINQLLRSIVGK